MSITKIVLVIAYILFAPILGGLLEGIDRKISARMQRRVGPPLFQPFYDVIKLFSKQVIIVSRSQMFFLLSYMVLMVVTGVLFFAGTDILMCFFVMSTGATFLYYLAEGTFDVGEIASSDISAITYLPGFFIAFVFILTIKMRKSPFDLSTSHHMHQELVKGLTTEMGARNLAIFQVTEWYENVFLMGVIGLYIINSTWWSALVAIGVVLVTYFIEILIDNTSARVKYNTMIRLSWGVTALSAGVNLIILMIIK